MSFEQPQESEELNNESKESEKNIYLSFEEACNLVSSKNENIKERDAYVCPQVDNADGYISLDLLSITPNSFGREGCRFSHIRDGLANEEYPEEKEDAEKKWQNFKFSPQKGWMERFLGLPKGSKIMIEIPEKDKKDAWDKQYVK